MPSIRLQLGDAGVGRQALGREVTRHRDVVGQGEPVPALRREVGDDAPHAGRQAYVRRPGAGGGVEARVHVLEARQVTAYDDEVEVLLVLAGVVEQRPAAGGEHAEVQPGRPGGQRALGEVEGEAVRAGGQPTGVSDGRRGFAAPVVVSAVGRGSLAVVGGAVVGDRLGLDRPDEPAPAPGHREGDGQGGDEGGHAQRRTHRLLTPARSRLPRRRPGRPRGRGARCW